MVALRGKAEGILRRKWGAARAERLEDLVADPEIQAITVATPSGAHADVRGAFPGSRQSGALRETAGNSVEAVDRILDAEETRKRNAGRVFQMRLGRGGEAASKPRWSPGGSAA